MNDNFVMYFNDHFTRSITFNPYEISYERQIDNSSINLCIKSCYNMKIYYGNNYLNYSYENSKLEREIFA